MRRMDPSGGNRGSVGLPICAVRAAASTGFCGERAFPGTEAMAVAHQVMNRNPVPPSEANRGAAIPPAVDAAILRAGGFASGACVVKVAGPKRDPRFDLPAIGPETARAVEDWLSRWAAAGEASR